MSDIERFESHFEAWIQARADVRPRPFDAAAIARSAIGESSRWRMGDPPTGLRSWRTAMRPARMLLFLLAAVLVALLTGAALVGGQILRPSPSNLVTGGRFVPAGTLPEPRSSHTATLLPDGRVLIVGGWGLSVGLSSILLWDPSTMAFTAAGTLAEPRYYHTATLMSDGRVLIIGGVQNEHGKAPGSVDMWDPQTLSASAVASLPAPPAFATVVPLSDGRVLVTQETLSGPAAIWDPATQSVTPAGSLAEGRYDFSAVPLRDGRVLIIGGMGTSGEVLASAQIFDPAARSLEPAGSLLVARRDTRAILLNDDRVLVIGGMGADDRPLASAELWDPVTHAFTAAGSVPQSADGNGTATLLADGRVLIVGGEDFDPTTVSADAELWDPTTGAFLPTGRLGEPRCCNTATLLSDGRVLVIGGQVSDPVTFGDSIASAELWQP